MQNSMNVNESEQLVDDYLARKSRFVSAKEYEGNGKVLIFNSKKVRFNEEGKYGPVLEYTVKEVGSGIERIVNASATTLIRGLRARLSEHPAGNDIPLLVKRYGTGMDTKYVVEHVNAN
jgi:hypothetical protein